MNGYSLRQTNDKSGYEVYFQNQLVAHCFKKHEFPSISNRKKNLVRFLKKREHRVHREIVT